MKKAAFLTAFILLFIACSKVPVSLPENIPSDFQLNYKIDGGLSDYSLTVKLIKDSLEVTERNEGKSSVRKEKPDDSSLKKLYAVLRSEHPEKIKQTSPKENTFGRGGRTLQLKWDENIIYLSDSDKSFIAEENYESWMQIVEEIEKLAKVSK